MVTIRFSFASPPPLLFHNILLGDVHDVANAEIIILGIDSIDMLSSSRLPKSIANSKFNFKCNCSEISANFKFPMVNFTVLFCIDLYGRLVGFMFLFSHVFVLFHRMQCIAGGTTINHLSYPASTSYISSSLPPPLAPPFHHKQN